MISYSKMPVIAKRNYTYNNRKIGAETKTKWMETFYLNIEISNIQ